MSATSIILLLIFAFGASFTQRVMGFGFGIFIMTVLPHIMPSYGEATALSGALALVCVVTNAVRLWKYVEWKKVAVILITFLVVSFFSVKAVAGIDSRTLKKVLGGVLILISIYFFRFSGRIHIRPSAGMQVGMGTISGLMGGFFAMQGPPAVIYFLSSMDTKEKYMAAISVYFVIGNTFMSFFRFSNGFFTPEVGWSVLYALPAVISGIVIGDRVYSKMPIETIRKVVYAFMAVAGIIAIIL